MQRFIDAITKSLQQENWYGALAVALTLPDICGRLENPKMGSEKRFVAWWDKYVLHKYTLPAGPNRLAHVFLAGGDAYALRCAYLHEGSDDVLNHRARIALDSFHFITPPKTGLVHCNQSNNLLQLQIDLFCKDICDGVSQWINDTKNNAGVKAESGGLLVVHDSSGKIVF
jgi:hypothetical protein